MLAVNNSSGMQDAENNSLQCLKTLTIVLIIQ